MSAATPLPTPHDECASPGGLRPTGPTRAVVRREVAGLLARSAAFRELPAVDRISLEHHLNKVAGYAAECVRDDWASSARLGQRPVLVRRRPAPDAGAVPVSALAAGEDFTPAAAGNIAGVTSATLRALSFPDFVADLIRGTFTAIVNSSIQQMEAYTRLLEDVAKTVDQFMADNITDNQARDWLVQSYPKQIALANGEPRLVAAPGADDTPDPGWREALMLSDDVPARGRGRIRGGAAAGGPAQACAEPAANAVHPRPDGDEPDHRDRGQATRGDVLPRRHDGPGGAAARQRLRLSHRRVWFRRLRAVVRGGLDVCRVRAVGPVAVAERDERGR